MTNTAPSASLSGFNSHSKKEFEMQVKNGRWILGVSMALLFADSHIAKVLSEEPPRVYKHPSETEKEFKFKFAGGQRYTTPFVRPQLVFSAILSQSDSRIGIDAVSVDEILRSHLGLKEGKGVIVSKVIEDSPAAKAGIQKNDVLIGVAETEITGTEGLEKLLQERAEKLTTLSLIRSGKALSVEITPRPAQPAAAELTARVDSLVTQKYWLGLGLAAADDALRSHLMIPAGEGMVVTQVEDAGPAKKAGVMVNDLLLKLDGKSLTTVEAVVAQLQEIAGKSVSLELLRGGKTAMLTVTPEKREQSMTSTISGQLYADQLIVYDVSTNSNPRLSGTINGTNGLHLLFDVVNPPKPDTATKISNLVQQVKQIQMQLESLASELQEPTNQPATQNEKK